MSNFNFVFVDHRDDIFIVEKLDFYRKIYPDVRMGMSLNRRSVIELPPHLRDIDIKCISDNCELAIGRYMSAALQCVLNVAYVIVENNMDKPNIILECDLEVSRYDLESRVNYLMNREFKSEVGLCCFNSKPPRGREFHLDDGNICAKHNASFGTEYPIAATTLGGQIMTLAGAKAIVNLFETEASHMYYDYLVYLAAQYERGALREVGYAVRYFTDYFFPSACTLAGLSFSDPINAVFPRHPKQAGDTVDANNPTDFHDMMNDNRFYVIHHLAKDHECFPGSMRCLEDLRGSLLEQSGV